MSDYDVTAHLLLWAAELDRDADATTLHSARCLGFSDESVAFDRDIVEEIAECGHPEEWDYAGWPVPILLRLFDAHLANYRPAQADLDAITAWAKTCGHLLEKIETAALEAEGYADAYVRDEMADAKMENMRYDR